MNTPLMNPVTEKLVRTLAANAPQSLLLSGKNGVGLGTIARFVAHLLDATPTVVLPEKDEKIDIDKGVIGITSIRRLYDQTRTKSTKNQVIIIDYAETMGHQAQNAFLKLLEEPGEGIYFVLATHTPSTLLPTVRSRLQSIEVRPVTTKQSLTFLDSLRVTDQTKRTQLLFMAGGLPAEMTRLVSDETYFTKKSLLVRDARDLIQAKPYQKLAIAQRYKDDRIATLALLENATNILKRSMSAKPQPVILGQIDKLLVAYQKIAGGGNIRLCLARFVL